MGEAVYVGTSLDRARNRAHLCRWRGHHSAVSTGEFVQRLIRILPFGCVNLGLQTTRESLLVFDAAGTPLARLALPPGFTPVTLSRSSILGVWTDALGVMCDRLWLEQVLLTCSPRSNTATPNSE